MPDPGPLFEFASDPDAKIALKAFSGALGFGEQARERILEEFDELSDVGRIMVGQGDFSSDPLDEEGKQSALGRFAAKNAIQISKAAGTVATAGVAEIEARAGAVKVREAGRLTALKEAETLRRELALMRDVQMVGQSDYLEALEELRQVTTHLDTQAPTKSQKSLVKFADFLDNMERLALGQTHATPDERLAKLGSPASRMASKFLPFLEKIVASVPAGVGRVAGPVGVALSVRAGMNELELQLNKRKELRAEGVEVF